MVLHELWSAAEATHGADRADIKSSSEGLMCPALGCLDRIVHDRPSAQCGRVARLAWLHYDAGSVHAGVRLYPGRRPVLSRHAGSGVIHCSSAPQSASRSLDSRHSCAATAIGAGLNEERYWV